MPRVYVIVEGPTEESFVKGPLAEFLALRLVYITPRIIGVPGHEGGNVSYARAEKDLVTQLKQDRRSFCTTMVDYYGLGRGFPGRPAPAALTNIQKVEHIERAIKENICGKHPDLRADVRFIPYLSLHEYEGLLFSDPSALATSIGHPQLAGRFQQVRDNFATPEDINHAPDSAPSKRIAQIHSSYSKVIDGTLAARAIGVQRMRQECPHFRSWLEQLEALPEL